MESLKPLMQAKDNLEALGNLLGDVDPYNMVEMMPPNLRESLGDALWAYSANKDALTTKQEEGDNGHRV